MKVVKTGRLHLQHPRLTQGPAFPLQDVAKEQLLKEAPCSSHRSLELWQYHLTNVWCIAMPLTLLKLPYRLLPLVMPLLCAEETVPEKPLLCAETVLEKWAQRPVEMAHEIRRLMWGEMANVRPGQMTAVKERGSKL